MFRNFLSKLKVYSTINALKKIKHDNYYVSLANANSATYDVKTNGESAPNTYKHTEEYQY